METNKPEGSLSEIADDGKRTATDLITETTARVSGQATELSRKAQQLYADFAGILRDSTIERPFAALAIAAGIGFALGLLRAANLPQTGRGRSGGKDRD